MSHSSVNVTEGSGKRLDTWDRTISSVLVQDQVVVPGLPYLAAYTITATAISTATTAAHAMQVMAGSSLNVYITRITVVQRTLAGAAASLDLQLVRLSTAGTGGTAVTPMLRDTSDAAAGCTAMTLPSSKGTESGAAILGVYGLPLVAAAPVTARMVADFPLDGGVKPWRIAAGTSNGICLKVGTGIATATIDVMIDVLEASF